MLSRFFFVFSLQKFDSDVSCCRFFEIILFVACSALWICRYVFCQIWEVFNPLWVLSYPHPFSPLLLWVPGHIREFLLYSHKPLRLWVVVFCFVLFLSLFSLSYSDWIVSTLPSSSSIILSSILLLLLLNLFFEIFIFSCFSVLKCPFGGLLFLDLLFL